MIRPNRDEIYMTVAHTFALRATCPRAQVGAVIVRGTHIIAHGYNGSPPGLLHCDEAGCVALENDQGCARAVHAEANALTYAARVGVMCDGATMFCTHEPCLRCAQLILAAGLRRVVYATPYRLHHGRDLLESLIRTEHFMDDRLYSLITDG